MLPEAGRRTKMELYTAAQTKLVSLSLPRSNVAPPAFILRKQNGLLFAQQIRNHDHTKYCGLFGGYSSLQGNCRTADEPEYTAALTFSRD